MSDFALYGQGALANGAFWSSRIYATGNIAEDTAATAIHTAWGDLWAQITTYLPVATTLTETFAATLSPAWKFSSATSTDEDLAGTSGSETMPVGTAALITWRTASRAKSNAGRSFMPAAAVNAIATAADTGFLLPAFQTALKTGATDFFDALTAAALTPVILTRATLTTRAITAPQVGNKFRRQFRRGDKIPTTYM